MSRGPEDDAWLRARQQAAEQTVAAVLASNLAAVRLTTEAEFTVDPPLDLADHGRLYRIEVTATRHLGVEPVESDWEAGEPPHLHVRGWVHPLNVDGTLSKRSDKSWVSLGSFEADGLVGPLLGRAHVS